jgi:hypothetical protein
MMATQRQASMWRDWRRRLIGFLKEMSIPSMTHSCQQGRHVMYVVELALRGHSKPDLGRQHAFEICRLIQFQNPKIWWHASLELQDTATILRRL